MMEAKLKHLDMIQAVINRMASNSFVFKGWAVSIIVGISAFATKDANKKLLLIALMATLLFWIVDAFYLSLERRYRDLFVQAAATDPKDTDFNMALSKETKKGSWGKAIFAPILLVFYGSISLMLVITVIIIKKG